MPNAVTQIPAANASAALAHFETGFTYETDCWDVHEAMSSGDPGFVLLDVRSPALYAKGHAPGAENLPHAKIIESKLSEHPQSTLLAGHVPS